MLPVQPALLPWYTVEADAGQGMLEGFSKDGGVTNLSMHAAAYTVTLTLLHTQGKAVWPGHDKLLDLCSCIWCMAVLLQQDIKQPKSKPNL